MNSIVFCRLCVLQVCVGAVQAQAVRLADGVRLRAHVKLGAKPDVGRGRAGLLSLRHAQPQGQALARNHLPELVRLVRKGRSIGICSARVTGKSILCSCVRTPGGYLL